MLIYKFSCSCERVFLSRAQLSFTLRVFGASTDYCARLAQTYWKYKEFIDQTTIGFIVTSLDYTYKEVAILFSSQITLLPHSPTF